MTSTELEERARLDTRDARIRSTYDPPLPDINASTLATDVDFPSPSPNIPLPPAVPTQAPPSALRPTFRFAGSTGPSGPRRSSRSTKGTWSSTRLSEEQAQERLPTDYVDKVFLSSVLDSSLSHTDSLLAYQADLHTDFSSGEVHCADPRAYLAKTKKKHDADNPTYHDAMSGDHSAEYQKAMCVEIKQLISQNTWNAIDRDSVPKTADGKPRPMGLQIETITRRISIKIQGKVLCQRRHAKGRHRLF